MSFLFEVTASDVVWRTGWTLMHSLWQCALVAAVLAILLQSLQRRSANARYVAACACMAVMLFGFLATFLLMPATGEARVGGAALEPTSSEPPAGRVALASGGMEPDALATESSAERSVAQRDSAGELTGLASQDRTSGASSFSLRKRAAAALAPWLRWIAAGWLLGVLFLSVRNVGGWVTAQRLCVVGVLPVEPRIADGVFRLVERMKVTRPVRLLRSAVVEVPITLGWLRPAILLPIGLLTGLTPPQLDAIIIHELAHVRRHDYLVNLLQKVVETLLFYHPAVWWVSRRIRVEREACCDEMAVAGCGDRVLYARALARLEEFRRQPVRRLPAIAGVAADGAPLVWRIRRVLRLSRGREEGGRAWLGASVAVLLLIGGLAGYGATAGESPPRPPQAVATDRPQVDSPANQQAAAEKEDASKPRQQAADPLARDVEQVMLKADELAVWRRQRCREYLRSLSDEELAELYRYKAAQGGIAFDLALAQVRKDRQGIVGGMLRDGAGPLSEADEAALRERREKLVTELAALGTDAVPALVREMDRGKPPRPALAREAVVHIGDRAVEPLMKLWNSPGAPKEAVIDILTQLGDPRSKDIFLEAVDDPSGWVRSCACEGLVKLGPEVVGRDRLQAILIGRLEDGDCLHEALAGLRQYGDRAAVGPLRVVAKYWPGRGKADLRRSARLAIREILQRAGEPVPEDLGSQRSLDSEPAPSAEELSAAAACSNAGIRRIALQALAGHRGEQIARFLLRRLEEEPRDDVLSEVYHALGSSVLPSRDQALPSASASVIQEAFDALVAAARNAQDRRKEAAVSAAATVLHAAVLGGLKEPLRALAEFKQLIRDGLRSDRQEMMTPYYRAITAIAVNAGTATTGWSGEERKQLQEELLPRLKGPRPDIRMIECVGHVGDGRALEPLMKLLGHEDAMVRQFAATALGRIGDPAALPALRRLADSDPAQYANGVYHVREAAGRAVRAIEARRSAELPAAPAETE